MKAIVIDEYGGADKLKEKDLEMPETSNRGTYAEYTTAKEKLIAKIPDNITFKEAAAVPLAGLTAYQCL